MSSAEQIASLGACAEEILAQYDLANVNYESINHEYNSTFKVTTATGQNFALRINVNSKRTPANLLAEIAFIRSIESVSVPKPQASVSGTHVTKGWHEASGRHLDAVLYSWLPGEELGDEPTDEQLHAVGQAMAKLHLETKHLSLPAEAELPDLADFFWGGANHLFAEGSPLIADERALFVAAISRIEHTIGELYARAKPQPIHADMHPWNLMWHEGQVAVFDFDDSGIGLAVQDLATALYYLDTEEQRAALVEGYASVAALPTHTPQQMDDLLLQRRIFLLNYLLESSTPEHREMIPKYLAETLRRIAAAHA